jgi:hypothetical protein
VIRRELTIGQELSVRAAIQAANKLMGLSAEGTLPAQADAPLKALGVLMENSDAS